MRHFAASFAVVLAISAIAAASDIPRATPPAAELHYQCGDYAPYPHISWYSCGPAVKLQRVADEGRVVDDVPDELKLDADQQKAVDSFAPPLSAIAVTCNGMAVSLFIQLDADHLFRADPRQSDMFTNVKGKMVQSKAPPMEWKVAYALAERAVLSSHVVVPCADDKGI